MFINCKPIPPIYLQKLDFQQNRQTSIKLKGSGRFNEGCMCKKCYTFIKYKEFYC